MVCFRGGWNEGLGTGQDGWGDGRMMEVGGVAGGRTYAGKRGSERMAIGEKYHSEKLIKI